jgi:hypothetical protein
MYLEAAAAAAAAAGWQVGRLAGWQELCVVHLGWKYGILNFSCLSLFCVKTGKPVAFRSLLNLARIIVVVWGDSTH